MVSDKQDVVDKTRGGFSKSIEDLSRILRNSDLFVEEMVE